MKIISLKITGMTCSSCVRHIENDLKELSGIHHASVNFGTETGEVHFDESKLNEQQIIEQIKKTGYGAQAIKSASTDHAMHSAQHEMTAGEDHSAHIADEDELEIKTKFRKFVAAAILSAPVIILTFFVDAPGEMKIMMALTFAILAYSGRDFFIKGVPSLLRGRPAMETLVAIGMGAAFIYSGYIALFDQTKSEYFLDVAVIPTVILLGKYLEAKAKGRAREAIKKLLELSAKVAHRVKFDGNVEDIPVDHVQAGDRLRVKPGEKIPADGIILEGTATIDESMVTGESIPADKVAGDKVIGATINGNTAFTMEAKRVGAETVLSQIIKMVEQAQMSKAPIQKLVDIVSAYFVWGVLATAILVFALWNIVGAAEAARALIYSVAVLLIACPCALGIATPISIIVGSGKGATLGILIKNTGALEKTHKITAIAFDKTGTITKGEPEVHQFETVNASEPDVLSLALSLEEQSEHPLARSLVKFTREKKAKGQKVDAFEAKTGLGVKGMIGNKIYFLGSSRYMEELGRLNDSIKTKVRAWQEQGYTVLLLADDGNVIGMFGVQDGVKETSKTAIELLKKRGIRTIMLTGDNEKVAQHIASEVGIDEIHAHVTPDKKKEIIEKLQNEGHFVAMAGDGINDSPALAQADVGIAMGTGTDVAMETCDLVLVKGDLMKAVEAIELSRATLRNIKQNLFWAFIYNAVGIPLAALGFLTPAFSAAAMGFSSLSVVLNALRLKRFRIKL